MKIDLKKQLPDYAPPRGAFELVHVPARRYLAIDGEGDPNTAVAYLDAVRTIYAMAYRLKALSKAGLERDYVVMPLEALWSADDATAFTTARDKSRWRWTVLNLVPDWITDDLLDAARTALDRKGDVPMLDALRVETIEEGLVAQTLHIGSYDDEAPVLAAMHDGFIPSQSLRMTGRHHEIYLSDARRTAPERLRTILRQPVERRERRAARSAPDARLRRAAHFTLPASSPDTM